MKYLRWLPGSHRSHGVCPECGELVPDECCEVCGYDLVRKTQAEIARYKPPA